MLQEIDSDIESKGKFKSIPEKIILYYRIKSEIKMDKRKLVRIIVKDLEELKFLSEEVKESKTNPALIIELALSKARLLCQEIELLRELSNQEYPVQNEDELNEESDDEVSDFSISDPELEILNFEDQEFPEIKSLEEIEEEKEEETSANESLTIENQEDSDAEDINEDDVELEDEDDQNEESEMPEFEIDSEEEMDEEMTDESEEIDEDEEILEDDVEEESMTIIDEDETDEEIEEEVEFEEDVINDNTDTKIQVVELKDIPQTEVREINIDEQEDNDFESMPSSQQKPSFDRPVMHEIPKPEDQIQEKKVVGETFRKERSLNDTIGENNSTESNLSNGPIANLRSAIGLNDRFLFIREIFENNTDRYNMIIDNLDKLETIQQAVDYLKANITLQKNDTSMRFVDLLKRRFSK